MLHDRLVFDSRAENILRTRPKGFTFPTAILTVILLFAWSSLAAQVSIDGWSGFGSATANDSQDPDDLHMVVASGTIGGGRHVIADRQSPALSGDFSAVVLSSPSDSFGHAAGPGSYGRSAVIWDGRVNRNTAFGGASLNPIDENSFDPTGLRQGTDLGVDLTASCPINARAFSFIGTNDNNVDATVTVSIYTDGTNWAQGQAIIPPGSIAVPISIPFSGAGGFTNQSGAVDFENVGAVKMTIDTPNVVSADARIESAITNCGFDFGDAPEGGTNGFWYTTTIGVKADQSGSNIFNNTEGGPSHRIGGPFIGTGPNDTDAEADGIPSPDADGDDLDQADDEAELSFPAVSDLNNARTANCDGLINDGDSSLYCVAVPVTNLTSSAAQLVAWLDFSGGGVFDTATCGSSTDGVVDGNNLFPPSIDDEGRGCERSAKAIRLGVNAGANCGTASPNNTPLQLANLSTGSGGDWSTGNIPAGCSGTVVLVWDLSEFANNPLWQITTQETFARIRITTDTQSSLFANSGDGPVPYALAEDGEVEDHLVPEGTVPVGIHAFESRTVPEGIEVSWSTVSENENIGFYLWGDNGRQFELLTPEMVPAKAGDVMTARGYSVTIPSKAVRNVQDLIITAVDQSGKEEMYGMFSIGGAYGRDAVAAPIDWTGIRNEAEQSLARMGLSLEGQAIQRNFVAQPVAVDFKVQAEGMQRVSYQDLVDAGLDLRGVTPDQIAVTLNGQPVPRKVHSTFKRSLRESSSRRAVSGGTAAVEQSAIDSGFVVDFWGERPQLPDALYVDSYIYRISIDRDLARDVDEYTGRRMMQEASFHWRTIEVEENNAYAMGSVLDDPWYMQRLRANHSTDSFVTTVTLPSDRFPNQPAWLEARVAGVTDFPQAPDHHVELYFNGERVESVQFDGRVERSIRVELPADMISSGQHQVEVRLPGGTEAPADLVFLDSVSLTYAATLRPTNGRLLIDAIDPGQFAVPGIEAKGAVSYAWDGARLVELPVEWASLGHASVTPEANSAAQIWISNADAVHRPPLVGGVAADALISGSPDLLVIAHPAFMPLDEFEAHPLNDYIAQRESQGWTVALVDITAIQARYSSGMPLPQAVTRFLNDASNEFSFEHVLLVGGDSYDYHDRLGMGSLSFIPTVYGETRYVPHAPSDALMSDLDGDGLGDKAIGRWPVRSMGDLQSIVQKTLDWDANMAGQQTALWAADSEDPNIASFAGQMDRMLSPMRAAGWSESGFDTVQVGVDHFDSADAARAQFFELLEEGKALTGYTGHGSAGVWSFQGFLFPSDIADLYNDGFPTLIGTMACYTSYFSSPSNDTVAHRWMNGFRLDRSGQPVQGAPNGAVAVHGAATLSNYAQNEVFASEVLKNQLRGVTLGRAVLLAREAAYQRQIKDLVVNWTLLGDPTIRLNQPEERVKSSAE